MEDDIIICNCMGVMKSEIVAAIRADALNSAEEVSDITDAGTMCGSCIPDIEDLLHEIKSKL